MMKNSQNIDRLKAEILSVSNPEKQKLMDELIELQGFAAMRFIQSLFLIDPFRRNPANEALIFAAAYGVKKLMRLRARESVEEFKFCPRCKSSLCKYEIIDPYSVGLKCSNNHKFHVETQQNDFYENNLRVDKDSNLEIAKEWLVNTAFRQNIQSQVAEILRKYVEQSEIKDEPTDESDLLDNYCPVCSLAFKEFKQDDVWVIGLTCANGHIFYSRNGLNYKNSTLKPDIDEATFEFLIDGYISPEQKDQLPDQILNLFKTIKGTIKNSDKFS
jgi:hypothetical protein